MDNFPSRAAAHLIFCLFFLANCSSEATLSQACSKFVTPSHNTKSFATCIHLGSLGASLSWSLFPDNNTLEMVFSAAAESPSGWVGWGINPGPAPTMNGSSVLLAFMASNGSNLLPYKLSEQTLSGVAPSCGRIDLKVLDQAVEISGNAMKIYAVLQLGPNQRVLNLVWNRGPGMDSFKPLPHDFADKGSLRVDIASGSVTTVKPPYQQLKNRHGIINVVAWGILLPLGAMAARYLRPFEVTDPAWFYIHAICQSAAYIIGAAGWATGLRLGSLSKGVIYAKHRNIGIFIFTFATLQVLSALVRPKRDHKIRSYWTMYHHTMGYSTIILAIVNIFQGLDILQPKRAWRNAYLGILIALGGVSLILEILTWAAYIQGRRKSAQNSKESNANDHVEDGGKSSASAKGTHKSLKEWSV